MDHIETIAYILKKNPSLTVHRRSPLGSVLAEDELEIHENITCDLCFTSPIVGRRYKSTTKIDYDLCYTCFKEGVVDDDEYEHIALGTNLPEEKLEVHENIACDMCYVELIVGRRYKSNIIDYNICHDCFKQEKVNPTQYRRIALRTVLADPPRRHNYQVSDFESECPSLPSSQVEASPQIPARSRKSSTTASNHNQLTFEEWLRSTISKISQEALYLMDLQLGARK